VRAFYYYFKFIVKLYYIYNVWGSMWFACVCAIIYFFCIKTLLTLNWKNIFLKMKLVDLHSLSRVKFHKFRPSFVFKTFLLRRCKVSYIFIITGRYINVLHFSLGIYMFVLHVMCQKCHLQYSENRFSWVFGYRERTQYVVEIHSISLDWPTW
jgi:hypothetical protein